MEPSNQETNFERSEEFKEKQAELEAQMKVAKEKQELAKIEKQVAKAENSAARKSKGAAKVVRRAAINRKTAAKIKNKAATKDKTAAGAKLAAAQKGAKVVARENKVATIKENNNFSGEKLKVKLAKIGVSIEKQKKSVLKAQVGKQKVINSTFGINKKLEAKLSAWEVEQNKLQAYKKELATKRDKTTDVFKNKDALSAFVAISSMALKSGFEAEKSDPKKPKEIVFTNKNGQKIPLSFSSIISAAEVGVYFKMFENEENGVILPEVFKTNNFSKLTCKDIKDVFDKTMPNNDENENHFLKAETLVGERVRQIPAMVDKKINNNRPTV